MGQPVMPEPKLIQPTVKREITLIHCAVTMR